MATPEPPKYGAGPTSLPHPSGFTESINQRGTGRELADGGVTFDLVDSGIKRSWSITWTNVTTSDRTDIETFVTTLDAGTSLFRPPQESGGSDEYTVTRDEGLTAVEWTTIRDGAGNFLHTASLTLRED